jgi:hypothetical protein
MPSFQNWWTTSVRGQRIQLARNGGRKPGLFYVQFFHQQKAGTVSHTPTLVQSGSIAVNSGLKLDASLRHYFYIGICTQGSYRRRGKPALALPFATYEIQEFNKNHFGSNDPANSQLSGYCPSLFV